MATTTTCITKPPSQRPAPDPRPAPRRRRPDRWEPRPGDQPTLQAIALLAARFSAHAMPKRRRDPRRRWERDAPRHAVEVHLIREALGWSYRRIARRLGLGAEYAGSLRSYGHALVAHAVAAGELGVALSTEQKRTLRSNPLSD